jgi:hypothetical protein
MVRYEVSLFDQVVTSWIIVFNKKQLLLLAFDSLIGAFTIER